MQHTPLLMRQLVERGAKVAPNEEIVTATATGTKSQTYKETRNRAHQLAHALADAGVKVGDRVGTLMWNNARHLEAYYAVSCMGAVLHTLNVRLSETDLQYIINHAGDKAMIVDVDVLPLLEKMVGKIPTVKHVIVATEEGFEGWKTKLPNAVDYEAFIKEKKTTYDWPDIDENSPLGLCYTSGTTGRPKGVMYEHRAQYVHTITAAMTDVLSLSATDSIFPIVPMFHAMAWGIPWVALMLGAKQVLPHRFMASDNLATLISKEEVTIAIGVPTIWDEMKPVIASDRKKYDFSKAERFVCGGSAPSKSLIHWYYETLGVEFLQGFGMTETSPIVLISRRIMKRSQLKLSLDEQLANISKTGIALAGLDVEAVDKDFNPLPHDGKSAGEFLIRGPWITDKYYKESHPDAFHNDWLRTGDVITIDADEYVVITDRMKDLIKSGGEWISSSDLESAIEEVDGIMETCVVAQPHPKWDERPVALVVLEKGAKVTPDEIRTHLLKTFAKWQLPDDFLFVDSIPTLGTGKMDKTTVKANLLKEHYVLPDLRKK